MVETLKLVYVIILFFSIFLCIAVSNSSFSEIIDSACKTDKDCPKLHKVNVRCRKGKCVAI
ncbi:Nodule Cysteine-Rich (NCR) secreted peptide [Medicago truncatula]|uniref:Nodule Cysteine-Rich (NCR) secreted peptide n=2 Tax=Medicago truncatula TaxID=3880 RepID=A0A072UHC2_MEDTR|nr:Nodule Cysteine-Rich (NCR) secreted peptide [Medicago truncatula]